MDCQELTKAAVAVDIMQTPEDKRLAGLFHCIYALFQGSFLNWIQQRYSNTRLREKLREDAKDAFQNGLLVLYDKSRKKEISINGSLKTVVYSFGLLQLLAYFKKDRMMYGIQDYKHGFDLLLENAFQENEHQELLNEKEKKLMEAISKLPQKQGEILIMKFFGRLRSKEIAEKLGVSAGNIDNESAKAYKALRQILKVKLSTEWS
ncbi:MAG: sigma-70 family RNA polymerase sigma factor [Williamsia sp.]|nr:sigma-70 family RNA polymerase sigma factor [Williamsia sp.]